ncbi:MAG TPA: hypothetical protein VFT54_01075 [Acidimicrobiia bacterium]|nr:hypothetical protein [Acidimicrobiia bacterium]
MAEGAVSIAPLVTHRFPLEEGPAALAALTDDPKALKMILEVS